MANLRRLIALVGTLVLTACSGSYYVTIHTPHPAETLEKLIPLYQQANLQPCALAWMTGPPPSFQSVWCDTSMNVQNYFEQDSGTEKRIIIYIHVRQSPKGRDEATALARAIETYVRQELPEANVRVRQIPLFP